MWSQSVNVFDPYVAIMETPQKDCSVEGHETTEDE